MQFQCLGLLAVSAFVQQRVCWFVCLVALLREKRWCNTGCAPPSAHAILSCAALPKQGSLRIYLHWVLTNHMGNAELRVIPHLLLQDHHVSPDAEQSQRQENSQDGPELDPGVALCTALKSNPIIYHLCYVLLGSLHGLGFFKIQQFYILIPTWPIWVLCYATKTK